MIDLDKLEAEAWRRKRTGATMYLMLDPEDVLELCVMARRGATEVRPDWDEVEDIGLTRSEITAALEPSFISFIVGDPR